IKSKELFQTDIIGGMQARVNRNVVNGVAIVSVQKNEGNKAVSELHYDKNAKLNDRQLLEVAVIEVENFLALKDGAMIFDDDMDSALSKAMSTYCAYKKYPFTDLVTGYAPNNKVINKYASTMETLSAKYDRSRTGVDAETAKKGALGYKQVKDLEAKTV